MALEEFLKQYFIDPALGLSGQGYNPVNTAVFGIILLVAAFKVLYPYLNKKGIQLNSKFALALLPYILFGINLRVLQDQGILGRSVNPLELGFYTYTPGIWILTAGITILGLILARWIAKKKNKKFEHFFTAFGMLPMIPLLIFNFMQFTELFWFLAVIVLVGAIFLISWMVLKKLKFNLLSSQLNQLAFLGQVLDGSATFTAIQFLHCGEQHVLSRTIIDLFSPLAFLLIKIPLIVIILYYIDKEFPNPEQENLKNFIKVFIIILGFATGLRDLFTIGVGSCN